MIHKATKTLELEFVILKNNYSSIEECQRFIQSGHLDNRSCKSAEDAWDDYLDIVKMNKGILVHKTGTDGSYFAKFNDIILKNENGTFSVYDEKSFNKQFESFLNPIFINENTLVL
jgi:hypothetical protein